MHADGVLVAGAQLNVVKVIACGTMRPCGMRGLPPEYAACACAKCTCGMCVDMPNARMRKAYAACACAQVAIGNSIGFVFYEIAKDSLCVDGRTPPWARRAAAARER